MNEAVLLLNLHNNKSQFILTTADEHHTRRQWGNNYILQYDTFFCINSIGLL